MNPITTDALFPPRIIEAMGYFAGQLSEEAYPRWVREVAVILVRKACPPALLAVFQASPGAALAGHIGGQFLKERLSLSARTQDEWNTAMRAIALTGMRDTALQAARRPQKAKVDADIESTTKKFQLLVAEMALAPEAERQAFFHAFAIGIGPDELSPQVPADDQKALLCLFMWLRWPEVEGQASIPAAYEYLRTQFASTGATSVVGSPESFRKFCNQIGFSRQTKRPRKQS